MFVIIGWVVVVGSVIGGYMAMGGKLGPLWQPFELVIIGGAGVGAYIVANPKYVLGQSGRAFKAALRGPKYNKDDYLELLSLLYAIFKLAKTKGMLAIESHIERPEESSLFQAFPRFSSDHHALDFLCDYLRMMTLGTDNPHELADLLEENWKPITPKMRRSSPHIRPWAMVFRLWALLPRCWASSKPWARSPNRRRCWVS